ncbi:hypothetical protein [Olsenella sp. AGMB03486]|uniref:hypothetical protein n=1 Tax=Olsenella sp. AGMB03486 TaxID=3230364 RepID=UPI0034A03B7D
MHKTFVIPCSPHADRMAEAIEQRANNLEQDGYDVVSFAVSAKAIILARKRDSGEA